MAIKEGKIPLLRKAVRLPGKIVYLRTAVDLKKDYFFVKRFCDLLFSLLVIVCVLSWLLPVLSILIKIDSRGPVLFLQKRTGKGGMPFTCFKLRTMVVNEQADECPALDDDIRVTRLGKFLRKSNLDELPQFFNVLAGTMSMVGPRPHMLADCHKFSQLLPDYRVRNFVKPGITGLSQIKGLHGRPAMDFQTIYERCLWDSFYVRHTGFLLDFSILCKTILLVFKWKSPWPEIPRAEYPG